MNCLEALYLQDIEKADFEVVVVSDGRDPVTETAVARWHAGRPDMQLRFLATPLKKGPAAARNMGWSNAQHPLIAFTDDDCLPASGWLQAFARHYDGGAHLSMTGKVRVPLPSQPTDFAWNTAQLQTAEFVTANCCCSKAALQLVGGFDEAFGAAWREDSELQFKFITRGIPIIPAHEAVVWHPVRNAPWGVSVREQRKGQYNALLYKKFPDLFRKKIQPRPAWLYYITVALFLLGAVALVAEVSFLFLIALTGWMTCTGAIVWKRLGPTSKSASHIAEMVTTSIIIPFVSLYWQWYGAVKYRVLLF